MIRPFVLFSQEMVLGLKRALSQAVIPAQTRFVAKVLAKAVLEG